MNAVRCLRVLRRDVPLSRADIARELNVTRATVGNSIKQLLAENLVIDLNESAEANGAGRPGALVSLNPAGAYFIGLDISSAEINAVLIDFSMRVVAKRIVSIADRYHEPKRVIELLAALPKELVDVSKVRASRVRGVCISAPGIVRDGKIISAPWLSWRDVDVVSAMSEAMKPSLPLQICNDAVALASAVAADSSESDLSDVLLLLLAQGIGSAHLRQGRVVEGAHGLGGEVGHMVMGGRPEMAATHTFEILAGYQRFLPFIENGVPIPEGLAKLVTLEGSPALDGALDEWALGLATGVLNLIHILDPKTIVLGGPLAVLYPKVAGRVESLLSENLVHGFNVPPISVARFGGDGAAIGAAALLRESLFDLPELPAV
ncbi:ROK family transcriptional regulator [Rhizobium lentis]|uniref:ROK family transcriptional regulator n=2 Tax=Rhizobium lentis TaxID=1138194 RepID=A0A9Q3MCU1_9HYPH|nr:ROK family transcriptional regulator [Rhizobium lentis]MBX5013113.1 ROK family transcriptional regulator [Rhizobium lentis]MBX5025801.1 ROK family transcriptional regulator [Rhizobium lentis]MBX5133341.1 ROK family transcriptional regulator [Rhizobium lentis]